MLKIVKDIEAIPINTVNILIYGEPGIGKTSLACTASKPVLIDTDKGSHRSAFRKDVVPVSNWEIDIQENIKTIADDFADYDTVILDTIDTCLDAMGVYIIKKDSKLIKNQLGFYGVLKKDFASFANLLRSLGKDIIMIAHVKAEKEGDIIKKIPQITGGTYDKVLQVADFIGYVCSVNNKSSINFYPTDTSVGKNSAKIPFIEIPDFNKEPDFFAKIIKQMKESMNQQSQAQVEAVQLITDFKKKITDAKTPDEINSITEQLRTSNFSKSIIEQIKVTFKKRIAELGYEQDKVTKQYYEPKKAEPEAKATEKEINPDDISEKVEALKKEMNEEIEETVEEAEFV